MGRGVLLQEGEDLLFQFRPHPASYFAHYAWGLLWLLWGAAALGVTILSPDWPPLGLLAFALLAALHALLLRTARRPGVILAALWVGLGLVLAILVLVRVLGAESLHRWILGGLALLASLLFLAWAELDRRVRSHELTTRRLQIRGGLTTHHQHTVALEKVQDVRGTQTPLGQLFGYGRLTLVLGTRLRTKKDPVEDLVVLEGVPRFERARHQVEAAVAELRLPDRERQRRSEERRLKASMTRLAAWVGRQGA